MINETRNEDELNPDLGMIHIQDSMRVVLDIMIDNAESNELVQKRKAGLADTEKQPDNNYGYGDQELTAMLALRERLFSEVADAGGITSLDDPDRMNERMRILNTWINQRRKDLGIDPNK